MTAPEYIINQWVPNRAVGSQEKGKDDRFAHPQDISGQVNWGQSYNWGMGDYDPETGTFSKGWFSASPNEDGSFVVRHTKSPYYEGQDNDPSDMIFESSDPEEYKKYLLENMM